MEYWKVVEKFRRFRIVTFWPWWLPFNSFCFLFFLCFPFLFLLRKIVCVGGRGAEAMLLSAFPVSPALKTTVLSECYLIIHKLLWCYNFAKSSECYVLKLLPSVLLLIPVLVLLTASLTILICLQINPSLVSDGCCMNALHMLLHMFQANLHLQIHEYLSSLKLLD